MNPINAKKTLKVARQILDGLPVTWWLSAGTALGAYRDSLSDEFLLKDTDIDIGVLGSNSEELILDKFGKIMTLRERNNCHGDISQIVFLDDGIILDFYFFMPDADDAVNYSFAGKMVKPLRMITPPCTIEVDGVNYPVPNPIEEYLEVRFGYDWREPKEHGLWMEHAANLQTL